MSIVRCSSGIVLLYYGWAGPIAWSIELTVWMIEWLGRADGQKGTARQVVGVVGNVSQVVLQMTAGWAVYMCQPYDCLLKIEQAHHRFKSAATV